MVEALQLLAAMRGTCERAMLRVTVGIARRPAFAWRLRVVRRSEIRVRVLHAAATADRPENTTTDMAKQTLAEIRSREPTARSTRISAIPPVTERAVASATASASAATGSGREGANACRYGCGLRAELAEHRSMCLRPAKHAVRQRETIGVAREPRDRSREGARPRNRHHANSHDRRAETVAIHPRPTWSRYSVVRP